MSQIQKFVHISRTMRTIYDDLEEKAAHFQQGVMYLGATFHDFKVSQRSGPLENYYQYEKRKMPHSKQSTTA